MALDPCKGTHFGQATLKVLDRRQRLKGFRRPHDHSKQLHVGASLQVAKRVCGGDGVPHGIGRGLAELSAERSEIGERLCECRHPQVQHLRGLLATYVCRFAGVHVKLGPSADKPIQDSAHGFERSDGVAFSRGHERLPDVGLGFGHAHPVRVRYLPDVAQFPRRALRETTGVRVQRLGAQVREQRGHRGKPILGLGAHPA